MFKFKTVKIKPYGERTKPYNPLYRFVEWAGPTSHPLRTQTPPKDRTGFEPTASDMMKGRIAEAKRRLSLVPPNQQRKTNMNFKIKAMKQSLRQIRREECQNLRKNGQRTISSKRLAVSPTPQSASGA